jgi:hypothetical protein
MDGTDTGFKAGEDGKVEVGPSVPSITLPADVIQEAPPPALHDAVAQTEHKFPGVQPHASMLPAILEKIHDPNYPLAEVNRLIAIEIAFVTQEMSRLRGDVERGNHTETFLQKSYEQQVKALQALEKSLTSTDILSHRDILNFDGPKFTWLFGEIVNSFKKACQDALGKDGESMVQSIMKHWRDETAMCEAEWRSGVEKIDSTGKMK